jgi:hypothetical protein
MIVYLAYFILFFDQMKKIHYEKKEGIIHQQQGSTTKHSKIK